VPTFKRGDNTTTVAGYATGSVWIKTTEPNLGARWRAKQWSSATQSWVASEAPIYASTNAALFYLDRSGGGYKHFSRYIVCTKQCTRKQWI
jgi:hypothetical protein